MNRKTGLKDITGSEIMEGNLLLDPFRNWHKVTYAEYLGGYAILDIQKGIITGLDQLKAAEMIIINETQPIPN